MNLLTCSDNSHCNKDARKNTPQTDFLATPNETTSFSSQPQCIDSQPSSSKKPLLWAPRFHHQRASSISSAAAALSLTDSLCLGGLQLPQARPRGTNPFWSGMETSHGVGTSYSFLDGMRTPRPFQNGMETPRPFQNGMRTSRPFQNGMRTPRPFQNGMETPRPFQNGMGIPHSFQNGMETPHSIQNSMETNHFQSEIESVSTWKGTDHCSKHQNKHSLCTYSCLLTSILMASILSNIALLFLLALHVYPSWLS